MNLSGKWEGTFSDKSSPGGRVQFTIEWVHSSTSLKGIKRDLDLAFDLPYGEYLGRISPRLSFFDRLQGKAFAKAFPDSSIEFHTDGIANVEGTLSKSTVEFTVTYVNAQITMLRYDDREDLTRDFDVQWKYRGTVDSTGSFIKGSYQGVGKSRKTKGNFTMTRSGIVV